jgi:hypothetical protein
VEEMKEENGDQEEEEAECVMTDSRNPAISWKMDMICTSNFLT